MKETTKKEIAQCETAMQILEKALSDPEFKKPVYLCVVTKEQLKQIKADPNFKEEKVA